MSELTFCDHTDPKPEVESKIDPDDGNSWMCDACRLPIFSTPFITTVDPNNHNNRRVMHDQCAHDLPPKLEGLHLLHLREDLILHQDSTTNNNKSCSRCHSICGSKFYKCGSINNCDFQLDLACALSIKILHRSHMHRLTAIKGKSLLSSFICAICGTQHQPGGGVGEWGLRAYVCSVCDFWIHPDCALLPNAIVIDNKYHPHPLLLTYIDPLIYFVSVNCKICDHGFGKFDLKLYACFDCLYVAHIKCAVYSDPDHISFKPVLIRDAKIPGLLRLPMPNENTSVMSHMLMKNDNVGGASTSTSTDDHHMINKIHEHPLMLHEHPVDVAARVCNACVQLISASDPFYSCSLNNNNNSNELASPCRDFFLHRCCAHLPGTLIPPFILSLSSWTLVSKAHTPFNMFSCEICQRRCNGFAYKWWNEYMDVVCAFMPTSIMHHAHAKSHILRLGSFNMTCNCCCEQIESHSYECNNCRDFNLHVKCALLPETVTHRFDRHPIKLITTQTLLAIEEEEEEEEKEEIIMFCEICEEDIDRRRWYYGCKECDQYFHNGCIPTLDELSRIMFGFTVRVSCHDCPVTAVRALSIDGYPCGHCRKIIRGSDKIAFECSDCYFRIHQGCAKKLLVSVREDEDGDGNEYEDEEDEEPLASIQELNCLFLD